jgi:hypothetical protein
MARRNYKPTGNPVGRPKVSIDQFPKEWKEELARMGSEGQLDIDCKVYLHISNETFARMMVEEPEFTEAVSIMRSLSHAWWARLPRQAFGSGTSKQMNSNLYALVMRNRFKDEWNHAESKVDITTQGDKIDSNKKIEIEIIKKTIDGDQSK